MKATLTRRTATSLPAPERGRIEYVDQKLPGFVLRVTANGARSWVVAYWKNGQGRRYTIAPVHLLDLDAAREQARELLHAIRKGADPMADRQAQRATQQRVEDETFGALFALYSEKARMKHRTWKNDESLGRNFEPWSIAQLAPSHRSTSKRPWRRSSAEAPPYRRIEPVASPRASSASP